MISAFGIEHTVSKSLVTSLKAGSHTGDWVKATELTAAQRKKMGGYKKLKGRSAEDKSFMEAGKGRREATARYGNKPEYTEIDPLLGMKTGMNSQGVTFRHGGAKGGRSHVLATAVSREKLEPTLRHERTHAGPRSEYRVHHQIQNNPERLGGEEGKADMSGLGHYKDQRAKMHTTGEISPYATGNAHHFNQTYPHLSPEESQRAVKAYESVQDKILAARGGKPSQPRPKAQTPPKAAPRKPKQPNQPRPMLKPSLGRRIVRSKMAQRFLNPSS